MKLSKEQFENIVEACCNNFKDLGLKLGELKQIIFNDGQKEEFAQGFDNFEAFKILNSGLFKGGLTLYDNGSVLVSFDKVEKRYYLRVNSLTKAKFKELTTKHITDYVPLLIFGCYDLEKRVTSYYSVFLYNNANLEQNKPDFRLDYVVSFDSAKEKDLPTEKQTSEQITKKFIKENFVIQKPLTTTAGVEIN